MLGREYAEAFTPWLFKQEAPGRAHSLQNVSSPFRPNPRIKLMETCIAIR